MWNRCFFSKYITIGRLIRYSWQINQATSMLIISIFNYSGTPFERPPWWEATPSGKATWQCKSKHKCIDFYPWREVTFLVQTGWPHKRSSTVSKNATFFLLTRKSTSNHNRNWLNKNSRSREIPQWESYNGKYDLLWLLFPVSYGYDDHFWVMGFISESFFSCQTYTSKVTLRSPWNLLYVI